MFAFQLILKIKMIFTHDENREATVSERFFSGSLAGAMSQSIIYPLEVFICSVRLDRTNGYSLFFLFVYFKAAQD